MKFTMRKCGEMLVTLRITQYIGRPFILAVMVNDMFEWEKLTRKDIEKQVRDILEWRGTAWAGYYHEKIDAEDFERDKAKVEVIIDKLFPELIPDKEKE